MADAAPVAPAAPAAPQSSGEAPAAEPSAPVEPKPAAPKKLDAELFELKINGKAEKLTREQVILRAQKAEAAEQRFQKAAEIEKRANEMLAMLESDPEGALRKLGKDPEKLLEKVLARRAEEAQMTPEQKESAAAKRERDEYKAKVEKYEAEQKTRAQQEADQRTAVRLEETLLEAAKAHGVDQTPETLEMLCDIALESIGMRIPITAEQVIQEFIYREQANFHGRIKKRFPTMAPEKLVELLGPEVLEKAQRASLKQMPKPGQLAKPKAPKEKTPDKGYLTEAELERALGLRK